MNLPLFLLGLVGCQLLFACQQIPPQAQPLGKIFTKGRKFIYQATHYAPGSQRVHLDTLAITGLGKYKPGQYDTTQFKIGYSYDATSPPRSFPGVLENDTVLWSHPPRDDAYAILELSPFPYIKLPARKGQHWTWELAVGGQWGNAAWATWQGDMLVMSHYQVIGQQLLATPLGPLSCWVVQAQATCRKGTSALTTYYHPRYGFVRLAYRNLNGSRLTLDLVAIVTVATPPDSFPTPSFKTLNPVNQL